MRINREDMLELTRRMTIKRNCFFRIAGAYIDADGYIDGTFNTNFLNLPVSERTANLAIAKAIPFAETNVNLKGYAFPKQARGKDSMWQLLMALKSCGLKNDALMEIFYEKVLEQFSENRPYAVMMFYACYDVPVKGTDKARQDESEEVYDFLICAICPLTGEYEPGKPESGFLFPAFTDRSSDSGHVAVFHAENGRQEEQIKELLGCE